MASMFRLSVEKEKDHVGGGRTPVPSSVQPEGGGTSYLAECNPVRSHLWYPWDAVGWTLKTKHGWILSLLFCLFLCAAFGSLLLRRDESWLWQKKLLMSRSVNVRGALQAELRWQRW